MLLKIVADARDIGCHLDAIREPDAGDFSECRVRFFRRGDEHPDANAALLRAGPESRAVRFGRNSFSPLSNQLTKSRQSCYLFLLE